MPRKTNKTGNKQRRHPSATANSSSLPLLGMTKSSEVIEIQAVALNTIKQRGEASEAAFLAQATALGFAVAKPWGDSRRYDFVVDSGYGLWRVQVKSTNLCRRSQYFVKAGSITSRCALLPSTAWALNGSGNVVPSYHAFHWSM